MRPRPSAFEQQDAVHVCNRGAVVIWTTALVAASVFTVYEFNRSSREVLYEGLSHIESANTSRFLFTLPGPRYTHAQSVIVLNIDGTTVKEFNVDADVNFQWHRRPSQLVVSIGIIAHTGRNRLMSTGFFSYDSILLQNHIMGDITAIRHVEVRYILGDVDFVSKTVIIRTVCSCAAVLCIIACLLTREEKVRIEQVITFLSLVISVFANCPIKLTYRMNRNLIIHCANLGLKGLFASFNVVVLCLLAWNVDGGHAYISTLITVVLFISGSVAEAIISDTRVFTLLFEGSLYLQDLLTVVVSASHFLLLLITFVGLWKLAREKTDAKGNVYVYVLCCWLFACASAFQLYLTYKTSHRNYAFDFFADYMLQTIFAFVLVDLHWSQPESPIYLAVRASFSCIDDGDDPA